MLLAILLNLKDLALFINRREEAMVEWFQKVCVFVKLTLRGETEEESVHYRKISVLNV